VLYIIRPDVEEEEYAQVVSKFEQAVAESGGTVTNVDEWGSRPFAYEIEHYDKGYYVLMTFTLDADKLPELDERFKLDDRILRHQIVRLEEKEAEARVPSQATAEA
jgi:small subunit ribosomal protein S6